MEGHGSEFLKNTGRIAAASALAGVAAPHVHAAENNTIQVALIGCGGRGTGAAANALSVKQRPDQARGHGRCLRGPAQRAATTHLKKAVRADKVDVPEERQFIGFDAYKKAMDCLKPGDVAIFATPLAFRWVHFTYAIQKGLNVFMEKPLTADGPTSRRMLKLAEEATAKNLKVGVGLMSRHSRALQELAKRIQDGEIGDIILHARLPDARAGRVLRLSPKPAGSPANCSTRSSASTASSGPAAAASATSTSTSSIIAAG